MVSVGRVSLPGTAVTTVAGGSGLPDAEVCTARGGAKSFRFACPAVFSGSANSNASCWCSRGSFSSPWVAVVVPQPMIYLVTS